MSRRLAAVVVLALAIVTGVVIGPTVFGAHGSEAADGGAASSSSASTSADVTSSTAPEAMSSAAPEATSAIASESPSPSPTLTKQQKADLLAGVLAREVPESGSGEMRVVTGRSKAPDTDAPVMTVRVEVEEGLDIDERAFAAFVMETLNDPRSWGADGSVRFARIDGDDPDIRVVLATPATVDDMCAPLATNGRWSCGRYGHAALNADRWVFGADAWLDGGGSLTAYRRYLVNHEVGHLLGHPHEQCPAPGELAPVMVQQSISLQGCEPNGWPAP